jgi:hypothetical protein
MAMVSLMSLWLPILISGVLVFLVSSVMHMLLPWHKGDYDKLPAEDQAMDALRPLNIPPGDYAMPRPGGMKEMASPGFVEKMNKGPVMFLTVLPNGPIRMGGSLVAWFVYSLVVSIFAAYVTTRAAAPGAEYMQVFRFASTTAFMGYALGQWQDSIWTKRKVSTTIKFTVDGLIYALLTAGALAGFWPG